jgi:hypothetical protein
MVVDMMFGTIDRETKTKIKINIMIMMECFTNLPSNLKKYNSINVRSTAQLEEHHIVIDRKITSRFHII